MKKILTLSVSLCFLQYANAQNPNANAQWRINGNSASTTDFIGTTNNQSLILKTNNVQRVLFDTQGKSIFDGGGEVIINPGGLNRPVLANPIANYMLKVGGSGHFDGEINTRQLFVQEYITYLKSLKGPRIDVDTIHMDSTRGIFGHTKIFGDVNIKQDLVVDGNTTLKGNLVTEKGFTFDGVNGITFNAGSDASNPRKISYGGGIAPLAISCAAAPWNAINHSFNGWMQIYDGTNPTTTGLLNFQTFGSTSFIDASAAGNTGGGLAINYFCGSNVGICTGANGGTVSMGKNVEIGIPAQDNSVALNIKVNGTQDDGLQIMNSTNVVNFKVKNTGLVYAREINVQINPFPDYVFKKDYKLLPLEEVEKYIQINKHLKGFNNADYYQKNGLELGELVRLQQEKIEELTLYLIELKKEIEKLKTKN